MTLDPEMRAVLDLLEGLPKVDFRALPPAEAAARMRAASAAADPVPASSIVTEDRAISAPAGPVPIRIYRPATNRPTGVLVNFHGGGWVIGSIASDDRRCRILQRVTGAVIVSVDYRLAPEHPFPIPLADCFAALAWAWEQRAALAGPGAPVAVTGSSSGANLAAAAAIRARDARIGLSLQLLICPPCDCGFTTASYTDNAEGYFLTRDQMAWFWDQYGPGETREAPLASVLRHPQLAGLAAACVIVAEYDPLRDEGIAYAAKLREAGVPTELVVSAGTLHSYTSLAPQSSAAQQAFARIGAAVRQAFAAAPAPSPGPAG